MEDTHSSHYDNILHFDVNSTVTFFDSTEDPTISAEELANELIAKSVYGIVDVETNKWALDVEDPFGERLRFILTPPEEHKGEGGIHSAQYQMKRIPDRQSYYQFYKKQHVVGRVAELCAAPGLTISLATTCAKLLLRRCTDIDQPLYKFRLYAKEVAAQLASMDRPKQGLEIKSSTISSAMSSAMRTTKECDLLLDKCLDYAAQSPSNNQRMITKGIPVEELLGMDKSFDKSLQLFQSFIRLITHLYQSDLKSRTRLVFRTFGPDGVAVLRQLDQTLGLHLYPITAQLRMETRCDGMDNPTTATVVLRSMVSSDDNIVAHGLDGINTHIVSKHSHKPNAPSLPLLIQDEYHPFGDDTNKGMAKGNKPISSPSNPSGIRHLVFDDNADRYIAVHGPDVQVFQVNPLRAFIQGDYFLDLLRMAGVYL